MVKVFFLANYRFEFGLVISFGMFLILFLPMIFDKGNGLKEREGDNFSTRKAMDKKITLTHFFKASPSFWTSNKGISKLTHTLEGVATPK